MGWALVLLIVLANAISRIYTGAHWPTDVVAGILIRVAWLSFVVSLKWISDRALASPGATGSHGLDPRLPA